MSTTWPWPLRRAWRTVIKSVAAPSTADHASASGTVTGSGGRSGKPVVNWTPANACAIRSSPRSPASGPVWPNGEMRSRARLGLLAWSASGARPSDSRWPGPWSSTRASAVANRRLSQGSRAKSRGSATTESLPRFSDWKYSESSPAIAGPRLRSGDPSGGSILMTVAPRSASSPPASSPARVCATSMTTTPSSAPPWSVIRVRILSFLDSRAPRGQHRQTMTAGRRGMIPADLTRVQLVTDPQLSPDGRRVAFVVTTLSEERNEYLANIWVVDVAGGAPRRFTAGPRRDLEPRWSPDGTRLAFLSERAPKDKLQLYVMPADGGEPAKLTALEHGVSSLAWSPDGSRLAFVSAVGGQREPDSEEEKRKSRPARVITSVKYRFNGEGFVYDRRPHVFVVSTDDSTPVQITDGDFIDADPTWSPDGDSIVFASARHAERDDDDAIDLWRAPAKGGTPQRLTATTGPIMLPAFSPDGRSIAYLARPAKNAYGRNVRLYVIPSDGGGGTCLTSGLDRSCGALHVRPLWSPDGRSIVVAAEDRGDVGLWRAPTSGSGPLARPGTAEA